MAHLQLDHIALPIFDVPASLRFYGELLGLPLLDALSGDDWGGKPWLMMIFGLADGRQVTLCALRGVARPEPSDLPKELRHFAFACTAKPALATWRKTLASHDVPFWEEDHGDQQSLYFEDPNGIVLEVTTPRAEVAANPAALGVVRAWLAR